MPEGDTVWQAATRLHTALAGRPLTHADLRVPRFATSDLTGRTVLDVTPYGKHLLTRITGGLTLHSHLRMEGTWRIFAPGTPWRGGPEHQIRAVLQNTEATAVGYRLPVLELLPTAEEHTVIGHLGPDLLSPHWDETLQDQAVRNLLAAPARPLGEALLDQRNLAGIGNVYKSELCFLARVTPWLPVGELAPDVPARLVATAHRLLDLNKDHPDRRTTTVARTSPASRPTRTTTAPDLLYVYGRRSRPCLRCRTPIRKADQGDGSRERPTYWCPNCQPGPTS
ncbi:putative endonuclease 8 2 [Streptomyces spiroverticillatus]|uniref:DNA-(apurinic or apyrimidinic site) lyase n=1 Tax=Streptomyces finlayi TaxID=67296 RepID=A0A918WW05_9ACTN|nr:Fpg/Nei family DNA glycosylase [Streptomyces finlayi]GHA04652.1 putative endonuclease 8 2 [Streptomyces spiroverticillatus]GHC88664.1 putative endonuclease 8 2 [Streptomyces finlayi]